MNNRLKSIGRKSFTASYRFKGKNNTEINAVKILFCSLAIFIIPLPSFAQNFNKPKKSHLLSIIKAGISQDSKKWISMGSGAWTICNQDSAFFKADTIKLFDNINYFYQKSSCCQFIDWTFYEKKRFAQSNLQICEEPASRKVGSIFYDSNYTSKNGILFLIVSKNKIPVMQFEVISLSTTPLATKDMSNVITLKRRGKNSRL
jgi:hypothetical protein